VASLIWALIGDNGPSLLNLGILISYFWLIFSNFFPKMGEINLKKHHFFYFCFFFLEIN
jgi:hypothetical protein